MHGSTGCLTPSVAASRLGVSAKALRIYEQRGLLSPIRSEAGWRAYGAPQMARAVEIVSLRALGLSLAEIADVLSGDPRRLQAALARQQEALEFKVRDHCKTVDTIRAMRAGVVCGQRPSDQDINNLLEASGTQAVSFDLPWPWAGETFELRHIRPLTYIVGSLGSGKTRLAQRLAETVPGGAFLGLERSDDGAAAARADCAADPGFSLRVENTLAWLKGDGATTSDALLALIAGLEAEGPSIIVVDMVEQGLDQATQEALIAHLRRRGPNASRFYSRGRLG